MCVLCSKCSERERAARGSYCLPCRASYMRDWRAAERKRRRTERVALQAVEDATAAVDMQRLADKYADR